MNVDVKREERITSIMSFDPASSFKIPSLIASFRVVTNQLAGTQNKFTTGAIDS